MGSILSLFLPNSVTIRPMSDPSRDCSPLAHSPVSVSVSVPPSPDSSSPFVRARDLDSPPDPVHHPATAILESPPLDSRPFTPHLLGIGIASPRPIHGPLSPFHSQLVHRPSSLSPSSFSSPLFSLPSQADPLMSLIFSPASSRTSSAIATATNLSLSSVTAPTSLLQFSTLPPPRDPPPALSITLPPSPSSHNPHQPSRSSPLSRLPPANPFPSPPLQPSSAHKVNTLPSCSTLPGPSKRSASPLAPAPGPFFSSGPFQSPSSPSSPSSVLPPEPLSHDSSSTPSNPSIHSSTSDTSPLVRLPPSFPFQTEVLVSPPLPLTSQPQNQLGGQITSMGSESPNPFSFQPPGLSLPLPSFPQDIQPSLGQGERQEDRDYPSRTSFRSLDSLPDATPTDPSPADANPHSATADSLVPGAHSPLHANLSVDASFVTTPGAQPQLSEDDLTDFDTEGYSALERIYLFSRSRVGVHRVFIARSLGTFLRQGGSTAATSSSQNESTALLTDGSHSADKISPSDAVQYVLPLLNGLAMDEDEAVKEALAAELVPIIWWFITHCKLVEEDVLALSAEVTEQGQASSHQVTEQGSPLSTSNPDSCSTGVHQQRGSAQPIVPLALERAQVAPVSGASSRDPAFAESHLVEGAPAEPTLISVQSFTPILGTLLLSSNSYIGGPARYAVVELLRRVRKTDSQGQSVPNPLPSYLTVQPLDVEGDDNEDEHSNPNFLGDEQRRLFEREMIHQVVIGMGKLDLPDEQEEESKITTFEQDLVTGTVDSYFPPISPATPPTHHSLDREQEELRYGYPTLPSTPSPLSSLSPLSATSLTISLPPPASSFTDFATSGLLSPPLERLPTHPMPAGLASTAESLAASTATSLLHLPQHPFISGLESLSIRPPDSQVGILENSINSSGGDTRISAGPWTLPRSPGDVAVGSDDERRQFGDGLAHVDPAMGGEELESEDLGEQAAMGRLSSMSLMAAVTASVTMEEEYQSAFVEEVQRVGRDPVYWVRREASFVVGALAKVVPTEVVISALLPLFQVLCHDATWQVRHSALFALPAILSRLPFKEKCKLALDVIQPMSQDESPTVRSGVLEALAEVIHSFHGDTSGPPDQLVKLFLGIQESETRPAPVQQPPVVSSPSMSWKEFMNLANSQGTAADNHNIYDDLTRPLVCAFNYPAVALTLGRARWPELRELYLQLSLNRSLQVRRTLAASLGEMAKIIGPDHSRQDLTEVWWGSVQADEGEVRLKAIECLDTYVRAVDGRQRGVIARGLADEVWDTRLRGWREREGVMQAVEAFAEAGGVEETTLRQLVMKGLRDPVAAVREAAINAMICLVKFWSLRTASLQYLFEDIREFATSASFRERMTYVACHQGIFMAGLHNTVISLEGFWETLLVLTKDVIVGVRITVARFLGVVSERLIDAYELFKPQLSSLVQQLAEDGSVEVKAFSQPILSKLYRQDLLPPRIPSKLEEYSSRFSRPPPPATPG